MKISAKLAADFQDYTAYHRSPENKFCHYFGIPMIEVAILGLLARLTPFAEPASGIQYFRLDGGLALLMLTSLWYFSRDWRITIPFTLVNFGLYFLGRTIPVPALWALFVVGWIFQLVGHSHFEKNRPALLTNLKHVLIGPLWIFGRILTLGA